MVWRAHLAALVPPEGYDTTALYDEATSGSCPHFSVIDAEQLARDSKDTDLQSALKAGGEVPGNLIARALVAKLAEARDLGVETKLAAASATAEAAAADEAAATDEMNTPLAPADDEAGGPLTDEPPAADSSADIQQIL